MATTNGFAAPKLKFRSSEIKKDTEFYKIFIAGKLSEENFKWPERPFKFVRAPHRAESIAGSEIAYGRLSPGSSQSTETMSNQLWRDMVKMVKGEKTNAKDGSKNDSIAPKEEPKPPVYIIYNVPNGLPNGMMPNIPNISNILGIPPQIPAHVRPWGEATPAHNPDATPLHYTHSSIEAAYDANQKMRANQMIIPLESDFNVDHYDSRTPPSDKPRELMRLRTSVATARFNETYRRTIRDVTNDSGSRNVAHSNHFAVLKNALKHNPLDASANPNEDSDSDLAPTYIISAPISVGPNESRVPVKKDKSSRSVQKRGRSSSKNGEHRKSEEHTGVRISSGRDRSHSTSLREKRLCSDKQKRSRASGKRGRSHGIANDGSKKQRVSPLRINKRNNTVVSKDEPAFVHNDNTAPATFAQPPVKFESPTVEDSPEIFFTGPIRISRGSNHSDGVFSNAFSAPAISEMNHSDNATAADDDENEPAGAHSNAAVVEDNGQTDQIDYDEMGPLQMSQSSTEVAFEKNRELKGSCSDSNDESDANELAIEDEVAKGESDAGPSGVGSAPTAELAAAEQSQSLVDSKCTPVLLKAKQKYPSDVPIDERLRNATVIEIIDLLDSDDDGGAITISSYSVCSSDEE